MYLTTAWQPPAPSPPKTTAGLKRETVLRFVLKWVGKDNCQWNIFRSIVRALKLSTALFFYLLIIFLLVSVRWCSWCAGTCAAARSALSLSRRVPCAGQQLRRGSCSSTTEISATNEVSPHQQPTMTAITTTFSLIRSCHRLRTQSITSFFFSPPYGEENVEQSCHSALLNCQLKSVISIRNEIACDHAEHLYVFSSSQFSVHVMMVSYWCAARSFWM